MPGSSLAEYLSAEFSNLRTMASPQFQIDVIVREIGESRGYRLFQIRKSGIRHLVDVRPVASLPAAERVAGVLVKAPAESIASKVISYLSAPRQAQVRNRLARHCYAVVAVPGTQTAFRSCR